MKNIAKDEFTASAQNMITNDFFSFNFADPLTKTNRDVVQTWALSSAFGRLNYSFKDRYLFEASYRYDGSSRLHLKIAGNFSLLSLLHGK